jgi:amino acid permease
MFSILNELKDNSPSSIIGVVGTSIGSAASIYIVVAITGYLTFGNAVVGNIVSMCTFNLRSYLHKLTKRQILLELLQQSEKPPLLY